MDNTEQRRATSRGFHAKARTEEQNSSLTDKGEHKGDNERERIRNRERQRKKGKGERERGRERSG